MSCKRYTEEFRAEAIRPVSVSPDLRLAGCGTRTHFAVETAGQQVLKDRVLWASERGCCDVFWHIPWGIPGHRPIIVSPHHIHATHNLLVLKHKSLFSPLWHGFFINIFLKGEPF